MTEQRAPNYMDYLGQIQQFTGPRDNIAPYAPGTKTMQHLEMDSANRRHAQSLAQQAQQHAAQMALEREKLALEKWYKQELVTLERLEFEAAQLAAQEANGWSYFGNTTPKALYDDNYPVGSQGGYYDLGDGRLKEVKPVPTKWYELF